MELSVYELDDLSEEVRRRTGGDPLGMLAYANRTGNLRNLLASIGLEDLMPGGEAVRSSRTIVVLGDSQVSVGKLRSIAEREGADPDDIEFCLEYDRLERYNFAKLRDKDIYRVVLFGPGPHSTPGKGKSESAINEMKSHPDIYPPIIEVREHGGPLKITANSFREAIRAALAC